MGNETLDDSPEEQSLEEIKRKTEQLKEINDMTREIRSMEYYEVPPQLRARYTTRYIEYEVSEGNMDPSTAHEFAESLIEDCPIPVTIGDSKAKIYPIETIVKSRPYDVSQQIEALEEIGGNYKKVAELNRKAANVIIKAMEKAVPEQDQKYGPFAQYLSEEQRTEDFLQKLNVVKASQEILGTKDSEKEADDSVMKHVTRVSLPNVIHGERLRDFIEREYSAGYKADLETE
jgi:hypothetical protein